MAGESVNVAGVQHTYLLFIYNGFQKELLFHDLKDKILAELAAQAEKLILRNL